MAVGNNTDPSSANYSDLEWSQVKETVLMLNLAVAQIENALRCGDESVATLTDTFTAMMAHIQAIGEASSTLVKNTYTQRICEHYAAVSEKMQTTVIAFQFYDKLVQRLSHLSESLAALAQLVEDTNRLHDPQQWRDLQDSIKASYTVNEDRALFDAVLRGCSLEETLRHTHLAHEKNQGNDDIELF